MIAIAFTIAPGSVTHANPSNGTPASAPADETFALDGVAPGTHVITLITGDVVTLADAGGSRHRIDVQPAHRSDGSQPTFLTRSGPGGVYVYPTDALPAVDSGRLDRELFNVEYLAENGYADAQTTKVPVLVQYPNGRRAARAAADALPASSATADLPSISGAGVGVDKARAGEFWTTVRGAAAPNPGMAARGLSQGIAKLWLDRKVEADLAESVPLIGAPQAWAAGLDGTGVKVAVLDTGIDAAHPDLKDRILASQSFIPDQAVADGHGHGTHVASTIVGSGNGSAGRYKGVAPGARLLVGKVLDDAGSGSFSGLIDGMEWAVENGADIVSMSIGAGPSDGTDPVSQAVNELTASAGTLFVIAAGNNGPAAETINAPGAAEAALTVAATSKTDTLADFSSRGPRLDGALKPDIAAPGVDIVAARAAGTRMGTPVDESYTSASGTSMATPHVAGAAAILAQQHPDWTGPQLKSALMSTTKDVGLSVYERGAGRLDIARATSQEVFATTVNLDFRPGSDGTSPRAKPLTYTNLGDQPVTLTLTPMLRTSNGSDVTGALSVERSLTVPAGGTATATTTLDATKLDFGTYSGSIVAEAAGIRLTVPVGLYRAEPRVTLTIRTIGADGAPLTPLALDVVDVDGPSGVADGAAVLEPGVVIVRVPLGTHSVTQWVQWIDDDSRSNSAWLVNPELTITADTTITFDVRQASRIRFTTPTPAQPLNNTPITAYQRTTTAGTTFAGALLHATSWERVWATPTAQVTKGSFRFWHQWTLGRSEVALSALGKPDLAVNAVSGVHWATGEDADGRRIQDQNGHPGWIPFTGTQDLPVMDVGQGRPEDLAGLKLKGKLALMETGLVEGLFGPTCGAAIERIQAVRDAGAAAMVIFPSAPTAEIPACSVPLRIAQEPFTGPAKDIGIRNVFLGSREGLALRDRVAKTPVTLRVTGTPDTPYSYSLKQYEEGRISDSLHYTYTTKQLAQVDVEHPTSSAETSFHDYRMAWKQDDKILAANTVEDGFAASSVGPAGRRDFVGPLSASTLQLSASTKVGPDGSAESTTLLDVYDKPVRTRQRVFAGPLTPGGYTAPDKAYLIPDPAKPYPATLGLNTPCDVCRRGNYLFPFFHMVRQNDGLQQHDDMAGLFRYRYQLSKDGADIPLTSVRGFPVFVLPPESGSYRLTAKDAKTDVAWTFRSARPTEDLVKPGHICGVISTEPCRPESLVTVAYDLGSTLGSTNAVPAGRSHTFTVVAQHAPTLEQTPKIAGLKLWASTDDGARWIPVEVKRNKNGTYTATTTYPRLDQTLGTVSLRAEAWDTAGNRVEQTSLKAFALRDSGGGR